MRDALKLLNTSASPARSKPLIPETRNMALQDYTYIKDYFAQLKEELGTGA